MIVNALSAENGSSIQTSQRVRMDFDFQGSGLTALLRMCRETGLIERVPLIHDAGSQYHVEIVLNGGMGDLFKYDTGAPFVGSRCAEILTGDLNGDCYVNLLDFSQISAEWLQCSNIVDPECE